MPEECDPFKTAGICYIVIYTSRIILLAILPILAIIAIIGGCIALIVVEIMRLICLNDTARTFDTYAESYE